jgi:mono/diheme cytochrome c family protein
MRFYRAFGALAALTAAMVCNVACKHKEAEPAASNASWQEEVRTRRAQIERAKAENSAGFEAMDVGSLGNATLEMIPYVVFRVLQETEPATFGDDAMNASGFFPRKDLPSGHNGIIWTDPTQADGTFRLRYMTRTCSSCHTGRVRLDDGTMRLIVGGANTEIGLHGFIGRITSTLKADLGESADALAYKASRKRILAGLASHEPGWFFGAGKVAPADAAQEVATVTANIDAVLASMRTMNDRRLQSIALLQAHSYAKVPNPPSLTGGAPGLIETSGLGSVGLVRFVGVDKADSVLPPGPSKADIPAIWQIDPTGYANWDGTIRGFARALTSSMAVVGDPLKIDLSANVKIQDFLGKLPPEPYPFSIDEAARRRGEVTYQTSCAGCHAKPSGRKRNDLVFDVGTDPLRAEAIGTLSAGLLTKVVMSICPQTQAECAFGAEGPIVDPSAHRGYVAGPLDGVWAVAPYLHNGSVPTLRQVLVPSHCGRKLRSCGGARPITKLTAVGSGNRQRKLSCAGGVTLRLRSTIFGKPVSALWDMDPWSIRCSSMVAESPCGWHGRTMRQTNASSMISSHTCFRCRRIVPL